MHARLALFAGSALSLVLVAHCAKQKPPEVAAAGPVPMGIPHEDAGEGGAGGEAAAPEPHVDRALVQKALDKTGTPTPNDEASHGLRFEVVEMGPNAAWGFAVINRGTETMTVAFDPRLLTLSVEPPPDPKAKKNAKPPKPRLCRLPDDLRPARADVHYVEELAPGHGRIEGFDPRLYCLPERGSSPLVAGARVTASFGWPPKTKTVWKRGKRVEEPLPIAPPFVAAIAPEHEQTDGGVSDDAGAQAAAEDAGTGAPGVNAVVQASGEVTMIDNSGNPTGVVKELQGTPFELGPDYAPPPKAPPAGLEFEVTQGSDASSESTATVAVQLTNHASTPARVYFRRELVTLEVTGVDGSALCEPGPRERSPDRQAFTLLPPHGSISVTSRLVELCPQDTFARPGLYLVRGAFDSDVSGHEFDLDAFVGHLQAEREATVRIRTGRLPFLSPQPAAQLQVGAPPQ
jgi:hypothetical protein